MDIKGWLNAAWSMLGIISMLAGLLVYYEHRLSVMEAAIERAEWRLDHEGG